MRLHFHAALVFRLLEHSKESAARSPTTEQLFEGRLRKDGRDVDAHGLPLAAWPTEADIDPARIPAGLWLVGDQGIYFMSNGKPGLMVAPASTRHLVAPAAEADPQRNPDSWWDVKRASFGGDDGVMFIDQADVLTLLRYRRDGRVCLDLTPDQLAIVVPDRVTDRPDSFGRAAAK